MEMDVVREGESCAPTATIAKITSYPYGIDSFLRRNFEHVSQRAATDAGSVVEIVFDAPAGVGIERIWEREPS